MLVLEIVTILSLCRNVVVQSGLNKKDLEAMLGNPTEDEISKLSYWNQLINSFVIENICNNVFPYHNYNDCLAYLKVINYRHFPIPLSYIKSKQKETIIAYYYMNRLKCSLNQQVFNDEQLSVINQHTQPCIVNASAGTGKTSTACKKAYDLRYEGVIFVSYTNASVRDDMEKMYQYPGMSSNVSKDLKTQIAFMTIDSLAGHIIGGIAETHDHGIREAINRIKSGNVPPSIYNYKHIIADECQDIDSLRYELAIALYQLCGFKSITLFGDPRQKVNEKSGVWYRKLWVDNNGLKKVGFTTSYRFKDQAICDMVNNLSERRPEIHHKLECNSNSTFFNLKEPIIIFGNASSGALEYIGNLIKNLHSTGTPYNEFMIIGPSITSETNITSKFARFMSSYFRGMNIPCKMQSEGGYEMDGLLFSTIQSAKGKEADYIFIFGINNYPNTFNMIPYQEAESLIYVLHSRARKKIFYIIDSNSIVLPRGIREEDVKLINIKLKDNVVNQEPKETTKIVTELCKCFDFLELIQTNKCIVLTNVVNVDIPSLPKFKFNPAFYGTLIGVMIQMFCVKQLPKVVISYLNSGFIEVDDERYFKMSYDSLFDEKNVRRVIRKSFKTEYADITLDRNLSSYTVSDYQRIAKMCIELVSCHNEKIEQNDEVDLVTLIDYSMIISDFITVNYGLAIDTETSVKYDAIYGSIDILTSTHIIEIKTTNDNEGMLQSQLYRVLYGKPLHTVVLNLKNKTETSVDSNRNIDYWKYIISKYLEIKDTLALVNHRHSNKQKLTVFGNNTFTVDTEFDMKSKNIFEIAIFNCVRPYRSILQVVKSDNEVYNFAKTWIDVSYELYQGSPTINDVRDMFYEMVRVHNEIPILYYYIADIDVKWSTISKNLDVSEILSVRALQSGKFNSNRHTKPKLIDYYNSHVEFHEFNPRAKHHTALTDALMLYEILKIYNS